MLVLSAWSFSAHIFQLSMLSTTVTTPRDDLKDNEALCTRHNQAFLGHGNNEKEQ